MENEGLNDMLREIGCTYEGTSFMKDAKRIQALELKQQIGKPD